MPGKWYGRRKVVQKLRLTALQADSAEGAAHQYLAPHGVKLEVTRADPESDGTAHRFRMWRFYRFGSACSYLDWYPGTGRYKLRDGVYGDTDPIDFNGILKLAVAYRGPVPEIKHKGNGC